MRETAPCKGCSDRCTACHGSCEKYKEWGNRYHAQLKHLEENKYRFTVFRSESRDKRRWYT